MLVVRPKGTKTTPAALAGALGVQTRFYPNPRRNRVFNYNRDFFMAPVAPQHVQGAADGYAELWNFATRNKYGQRQLLRQSGLAVPAAASGHGEAGGLSGSQFVVRPLRHSGGRGYRVTENKLDFLEGSEYISELFPKKREYRVIFVFGKPLIYLRKKPNEGVSADEPWGHINSRFQTINDVPNCMLATTDCVDRLAAIPFVRAAHIVAADILWNKAVEPKYSVLELNLCPALTIEGNLEKVKEAINARKIGLSG